MTDFKQYTALKFYLFTKNIIFSLNITHVIQSPTIVNSDSQHHHFNFYTLFNKQINYYKMEKNAGHW